MSHLLEKTMTIPQKNAFSDQNNVADEVAKIMQNTLQQRHNAIPDTIRDAAKAAGQEAKGALTHETVNSVYKKHFTQAAGNRTDLPTNIRQSFEDIANQERQS
jgi:hypothetical protein